MILEVISSSVLTWKNYMIFVQLFFYFIMNKKLHYRIRPIQSAARLKIHLTLYHSQECFRNFILGSRARGWN